MLPSAVILDGQAIDVVDFPQCMMQCYRNTLEWRVGVGIHLAYHVAIPQTEVICSSHEHSQYMSSHLVPRFLRQRSSASRQHVCVLTPAIIWV